MQVTPATLAAAAAIRLNDLAFQNADISLAARTLACLKAIWHRDSLARTTVQADGGSARHPLHSSATALELPRLNSARVWCRMQEQVVN